MKIGKKLREYRYRNNFSQKDIAQHLNISQSTYCDWESDRTFPKFENLSKVAKLYNIEINDLTSSDATNNNEINLINKTETTDVLAKLEEKLDKLVEVIEKLIESKK